MVNMTRLKYIVSTFFIIIVIICCITFLYFRRVSLDFVIMIYFVGLVGLACASVYAFPLQIFTTLLVNASIMTWIGVQLSLKKQFLREEVKYAYYILFIITFLNIMIQSMLERWIRLQRLHMEKFINGAFNTYSNNSRGQPQLQEDTNVKADYSGFHFDDPQTQTDDTFYGTLAYTLNEIRTQQKDMIATDMRNGYTAELAVLEERLKTLFQGKRPQSLFFRYWSYVACQFYVIFFLSFLSVMIVVVTEIYLVFNESLSFNIFDNPLNATVLLISLLVFLLWMITVRKYYTYKNLFSTENNDGGHE